MGQGGKDEKGRLVLCYPRLLILDPPLVVHCQLLVKCGCLGLVGFRVSCNVYGDLFQQVIGKVRFRQFPLSGSAHPQFTC